MSVRILSLFLAIHSFVAFADHAVQTAIRATAPGAVSAPSDLNGKFRLTYNKRSGGLSFYKSNSEHPKYGQEFDLTKYKISTDVDPIEVTYDPKTLRGTITGGGSSQVRECMKKSATEQLECDSFVSSTVEAAPGCFEVGFEQDILTEKGGAISHARIHFIDLQGDCAAHKAALSKQIKARTAPAFWQAAADTGTIQVDRIEDTVGIVSAYDVTEKK